MKEADIRRAIEEIRDILWLDPDSNQLDPEKIWTVETVEDIAKVLDKCGLRPQKKEPWKEVTSESPRVLVIADKNGKAIYADPGIRLREVDRTSNLHVGIPIEFADLGPVNLGLPVDDFPFNDLLVDLKKTFRPSRLRRKKR